MVNSLNLQPQKKPRETNLAVVNFTESLNKALEISRKLDSWNLFERLPDFGEEINYTDFSETMKKALDPCLEKDCKLHIMGTLGIFCELGWMGRESIPTIGALYFQILSELPERYIVKTLSKVVLTWEHGQYSKTPTPVFLKSCIPEDYFELVQRSKRMAVISDVARRQNKERSREKIGHIKIEYKKIDCYSEDL